jgi:hypothetical protein
MCMCNTFRCLEFLLLSYNDGSSLVPDIFYYLRNLMMYKMREIHEKPAFDGSSRVPDIFYHLRNLMM